MNEMKRILNLDTNSPDNNVVPGASTVNEPSESVEPPAKKTKLHQQN